MKRFFLAAVAGVLAGANAAAQSTGEAGSTRLEAERPARAGPLSSGFVPHARIYGNNETANPNDRVFTGFRTDPRLVLGYAVNDYLALETGYAYLRDEGFHKIAPGPVESSVAAGALGAKSFTTYVAARVTVPISERLSAYGKLGVAHSQVRNDGLLPPQRVRPQTPSAFAGESATGAYGAVGAKYQVDKRTTIGGEARLNGSAARFGDASNASAVKASLGVGF